MRRNTGRSDSVRRRSHRRGRLHPLLGTTERTAHGTEHRRTERYVPQRVIGEELLEEFKHQYFYRERITGRY